MSKTSGPPSGDPPSALPSAPSGDLPFHLTLEVRDRCLCLHTQRAARALARRFDDAFRPLGLTSGQFSLLMSLNRPEPPAIGLLAEQLGMDRTTLTAALKPLTRQGLATVAPGDDRRSRRPVLTDAGRALLARAEVIWRETHDALDAGLADPAGLARELDILAGRPPRAAR